VRGVHLVVGLAAPPARGGEPVADLHALHRLYTHEGSGEPGVEAPVPVHVRAQPRRQPVDDDLDDAADGVASLLHGLDLGDHRLGACGVERADRALVDGVEVLGPRQRPLGRVGTPDRHDVADDLHTQQLAQELPRDGPQHGAGRGLPGTGPLEHGPRVVEAELLHAREVGVPRPRPGERLVASQPGEYVGVHGVRGHDLFPLGPFGVVDPHGDRPALGQPVAHPAQELDLVGLEAHARAPPEPEPPAGELLVQVGGRDLDPGNHAFEHGHQRGPVRLPSGDPTQHPTILSCPARASIGGYTFTS
jgi:hypothetical protein